MLKTFSRILLSRIKKIKENKEIDRRIEICLGCEFNSLNAVKISTYKRFLVLLSDLYSRITNNSDKDNKGNCTACNSCSVYYKARELEDEDCPKNKWKN